MSAARNRSLVFLAVLLAGLAACDRQHDRKDFLPSSPAFQQALQLVLAAVSAPADGASTVRIEAQISPDADPDKRTVRFHTTLGSWVEPGTTGDAGKQVEREADEDGKAVAFLKSAAAPGIAVVTVSVLDKDGNVITAVTGEVEFTLVQGALDLFVFPSSTFADGVSPIEIEAKISIDSPASWTDVLFETDAGVFSNGMTEIEVPADSQRIARARLTSVKVEAGTLTATIKQFDSITVSRPVAFDARNPNAVRLGVSSNRVPADGATQINVFADIAAGLTNRTVTFTTTDGKFLNSTGTDTMTTAVADAGNRALVRLQVSETIGSVLLTAKATLNDGTTEQSSNLEIGFVRALPDFIELAFDAGDPPPYDLSDGDTSTTLTATLTRDIGKVSPDTVVNWAIEASDGTAITDMEITQMSRSSLNSAGDAQEATAVLTFGDADLSGFGGSVVVVVEASVAGSGAAPGRVSLQIQD